LLTCPSGKTISKIAEDGGVDMNKLKASEILTDKIKRKLPLITSLDIQIGNELSLVLKEPTLTI